MAFDRAGGLRERKKLRTRNELEAAALRLFSERGFDHVTIEDIAAAVEVSPSTFLRYFAHKDDVLFASDARRVDDLTVAMAARPPDEPVLEGVRHALMALADGLDEDHDAIAAKAQIMRATPSLRARSLENQARWEHALAVSLAPRLHTDATDLRVQLVAATSTPAVRVAVEQWLAHGADRPLRHYLDTILELLYRGLNTAVTT
jgi:AcrR family transcriptional regulator